MHSKEDLKYCDDSDPENLSYGGLARTISRSLIRKLGTLEKGIPRPRNFVANSADKFSDMIEIRTQVVSAKESVVLDESWWKRQAKILRLVLPGFLKSSIVGTVLYSSYDELFSSVQGGTLSRLGPTLFFTKHDAIEKGAIDTAEIGAIASHVPARSTLPTILLYSSVAGIAAGVASAAASISLEALFAWRHIKNHWKSVAVAGTCVHFAITNCLLFTTYECIKYSLLEYGERESSHIYKAVTSTEAVSNKEIDIEDDDLESIVVRSVDILLAGAVAGVVAEIASYYTLPLSHSYANHHGEPLRSFNSKRKHLYNYWRKALSVLSRPNTKAIVLASVPSALGFLAFELTR